MTTGANETGQNQIMKVCIRGEPISNFPMMLPKLVSFDVAGQQFNIVVAFEVPVRPKHQPSVPVLCVEPQSRC